MNFLKKYSQKTPHRSPVRARYGVSLVDPASDWYSAWVPAIIPVIYYYIEPCYNGTRYMCLPLYCYLVVLRVRWNNGTYCRFHDLTIRGLILAINEFPYTPVNILLLIWYAYFIWATIICNNVKHCVFINMNIGYSSKSFATHIMPNYNGNIV